jgi:decaprenylphospho-beta-D-erythro-pentofuranosid-2-ulose 2-reductase
MDCFVRVNFTGAAVLSIAAARALETGDSPTPVLLATGSVAGNRGRTANCADGAAKAGLTVLFQRLANQHGKSRPRIVLVKSGFVDTPITHAFGKIETAMG